MHRMKAVQPERDTNQHKVARENDANLFEVDSPMVAASHQGEVGGGEHASQG